MSLSDLYYIIRDTTSGYFYKFLVSIVLLLVGFILGRILGRLFYKFLHSLDVNNNFSRLAGISVKIEEIAETFTSYFVYFITIVIVLQQIGLATTILHMIAGGVIILLILSTFLGIKDFIPNAISGFFLLRRKTFKIGQVIKVKGMQGRIIRLSLVETKIQTKNGDLIFIPNSVLSKTEVVFVRPSKKPSKKVLGDKKTNRKSDEFLG